MLCPRSWYYGEYLSLALANEKLTGPLGFGGRIHEALEAWGKGADALQTWELLMSRDYACADAVQLPDLSQEDELGRIMLEGLVEWWDTEGEDQEFEVIGVEQKLSNVLTVESVDIWLYGKLDQLLRHRESGQLWLRDYKTTRYLEDAFKDSVEWSPQPRIYAELVQRQLGEHICGVRYTALRKVKRTAAAKPPFYFNFDLQLPEVNIREHMDRVYAITGRMVSTARWLDSGVYHGTAAPFNPGWQCKSCPFRNVCYVQQTVGQEAADDMIEDLYVVRDPFERYRDRATEDEVEV